MKTQIKKILIVDDESINLKILARCINRPGFELTTTTSSTDALNMAKNDDFDALITDYRMPRMSGIELLESVADCENIKLKIMLTAFMDPKVIMDLLNNHLADQFIHKPFSKKEINRVLMQLNDNQKKVINKQYTLKSTQLWSGLILSNDIRDSNARLLISAGTYLDNNMIVKIKNYERRQHENFTLDVEQYSSIRA